jgi:hypothetical protein
MDVPRSIPAVEYRTLWTRLVEMGALDPENAELQATALAFARIGRDAGAVVPASDETADPATSAWELALSGACDWDHASLPLSSPDAILVDRVAHLTVVPE